jgi:nicotinamide-nucleotide amidase
MKAEILSVGTELLLGEIVDTNAAYLAQHLAQLGIDLHLVSQVGDNRGRLAETIGRAHQRADLVIITGGLGPTEDDLTREAISDVMGEQMEVQPDLEETLRGMFRKYGREMPPSNVKQATLIPSAQALLNPIGTAPGWWVEREARRIIVAMPGVPHEMKRMWEERALPRLQAETGAQVIATRTLKTIGVGESHAEQMVLPLIRSTNPTLATYAKPDGVHLRMAAKADDRETAQRMLDAFEVRVRELIGQHVYGVDSESPSAAVGRLLKRRGLTVATMESASGGVLASLLTDTEGSSAYFLGGMVAYAKEMKLAFGVDADVLERHGTVDVETAKALARAARERAGADIGLGTVGVAGPDAVEGKPAGTLNVALDWGGRVLTDGRQMSTTRGEFKRRVAMDALFLLWKGLNED